MLKKILVFALKVINSIINRYLLVVKINSNNQPFDKRMKNNISKSFFTT